VSVDPAPAWEEEEVTNSEDAELTSVDMRIDKLRRTLLDPSLSLFQRYLNPRTLNPKPLTLNPKPKILRYT
jgi:hypothetical protein